MVSTSSSILLDVECRGLLLEVHYTESTMSSVDVLTASESFGQAIPIIRQ